MKFHITGADKNTGSDVDTEVVAADSRQAEHLAHERGILVSLLEPVVEKLDETEIALIEESPINAAAHAAPAAVATVAAPATTAHAPADTGHAPAPHPDTHHGTAHNNHNHHDHPHSHMGYKLMQNQSLFLLEKSVNKMIIDGWEPVGGLSVAIQNNALNYFQAIIRRPENNPDNL